MKVITREERILVSFFVGSIYDGVLDPKFTSFPDETWCYLNWYASAQNNRYWSSINLRQTFEVPLHDQRIGV
jgi:hypothetical protein